MKNEFTPYDRALKLKQLGFDEPCFGYYYTLNGKDWKFTDTHNYHEIDDILNIGSKFTLLAPTFSQAFRWFRENYSLYSLIGMHPNTKEWYSSYQNLNWSGKETLDFIKTEDRRIRFKTYEEAELDCLDKFIEIVESKNKTK